MAFSGSEAPLVQEALRRGAVPFSQPEGGRGWFRPAYALPVCGTSLNQKGQWMPMVPIRVALDYYAFLPFGSAYHGMVPWWYPACEQRRHPGLEPVMVSFRQGELVFGSWPEAVSPGLDLRCGRVAIEPATYACWRVVFAEPLRLF